MTQEEKIYVRSILFITCIAFSITGCSQKRIDHSYQVGHTSKARKKSTMQTYNVKGVCYRPCHVKLGETLTGISSWYGPNFHGKQTSSGEIYNMYARTAAHKTWPMDTMVKVTNLDNGRQTIVRINDRGPFVKGRVIDCSYAAGKDLGLDKSGIARVKLEVIGFDGKQYEADQSTLLKKRGYDSRSDKSNLSVQVGAFRQLNGARKCLHTYRSIYPGYTSIIKKFSTKDGGTFYRVFLTGFRSESEIDDFKKYKLIR